MPTLDLGKIKFVWKGAYNGATTYEVDDVVSYQGSSYIYKNATAAAGNLPTVTTHWDLLAQGSDLSVLNTQGQILFRGASGLQALAPSTSGYILRTNGAGANPSWDSADAVSDPATKIEKLRYPKHGYSLQGDNGFHTVSRDGRVYFSGPNIVSAAVSSSTDSATAPSAASGVNSTPSRHAVLPRGAKAQKVFNFHDNTFVIDTEGRLYSAGVNGNGQLGLGLATSGPSGSTTTDTTNRARYTQVIFPNHNYPQIGSSDTPKVVHVFSGNSENWGSCSKVYAIDSHGFLWAWGDNNTVPNSLGLGTGQAQTISSPVRIPAFMAVGSVSANPGINQPAASGVRKRIKKVTAIAGSSEAFALAEKDDLDLTNESGLFYWGNNTGCTASGTNTAATISSPVQFSRSAFAGGLQTGEWIVDIVANSTRIDAATSGTLTVLTNLGRMLTCGSNSYGVLANGGNTVNVFGNLIEITTASVGGGSWATPEAWVTPAGMTNSNFNVQWTIADFESEFNKLDETWSFSGTYRYAKTSNNYWCFWGTQYAAANGAAGVGNLVGAQYSPTQLMFRDGQHEENITYRTASDEFGSSQLVTGNALGFTISKVRHVGGLWNESPTLNFARTNTVVIMSNGRVYVSGYNGHGQNGTGDAFSSTGFFRRVRIDNPIISEGNIVDARVTRGTGLTTGYPSIQIVYSDGQVYSWGYSLNGSAGLGTSSGVPARVVFGGISY